MRFMVETASTGNWPAADSADSMIASAPSKIAVATSETSARVGTGLAIIDSSIWVATTTGLPARRRRAGELLLDARHLLQRHLHAEVAARHHDRVGDVHDVVEPVHRRGLLDLGHHRGAAAADLLRLGDVLRSLDERQPDPVDAGVERGVEIGAVLRGQRGERDQGVGQADALAVGELAADLDFGDDLFAACLRHHQADLAVVEQQAMTGLDAGEDFGMRQLYAIEVARLGVLVEREGCAVVEHRRTVGERADAQLRSLQVAQDADRPGVFRLHRADRGDELAHPVVRGVAHVDAERVGAGLEQFADHLGIAGGGAERGDDLGSAQPPHRRGLPGNCDGPCRPGVGNKPGVNGRCGLVSPASVSCTVQARCSPVSTSKKPVRS